MANKANAQETVATNPRKDYILIVPFSPLTYTVVGDHFICKSSNLTPGELSDMFRRSLLSTMQTNLSQYYNCKTLPAASIEDKNSDLSQLYKLTRIEMQQKRLRAYYKGYPPFKLHQILGPRYKRWGSDCVNSQAQKPNAKMRPYAHADIQNDSLYSMICDRNESAYVLYFTQFEMGTRFKNCIDLQNNVFQRDIFLHYTLLDETGRYIDGGVVGTTFQSSSNDAKFIIEKNLGLLSSYIVGLVRQKI